MYDIHIEEKILKSAKYYYKDDEERLREKGRDKYRDLSEEEKKNMDKTDTIRCLKKRNCLYEKLP